MVTIFVYQQKLKLPLHHTTEPITNKPMLDFKDVFVKGYKITPTDIPTLMTCKNIDFGHTYWMYLNTSLYYNDVHLMTHIMDNILDVNANDGDNDEYHPFIVILIYYNNTICLIDILLNNVGVAYDTFDEIKTNQHSEYIFEQCKINLYAHQKHIQLLKYLTSVSLNKFTKYYNLVKYYDMIHTMFLLVKVQKKVPNTIIKHLMIPFVYQR